MQFRSPFVHRFSASRVSASHCAMPSHSMPSRPTNAHKHVITWHTNSEISMSLPNSIKCLSGQSTVTTHGGTICCAQAVHCTLEHTARAVLFVVLVNNIKGHSLEFVALLCLVCSLVRFAAAIRLLSDEVTIVRTNRIASQALTAQR